MKRLLTAAFLSAMLLLAVSGCGQPGGGSAQDSSTAPAAPVATLGEYTVELGDYTFFYRAMQSGYEYQALLGDYTAENLGEFWNSSQDGMSMKDILQREALNSAKQFGILHKKAMDSGAKVQEDKRQETDEQISALLAASNNDEQQFLMDNKITVDLLREVYYKFDLTDQYQEELQNAVQPSEEEIRAEYEADKDRYDEVTVRHVLIASDDSMTEEQKAEAKAKAEDILRQLRDGAEIGELAREYSEDPGSKDGNGEYTFGKGKMVPEFEEWAFSASPGDQGIVQTSYGHHVMEMIGRSGYEEAKAKVEDNLRLQTLNETMEEIFILVESPDWSLNRELLDSVTVEK